MSDSGDTVAGEIEEAEKAHQIFDGLSLDQAKEILRKLMDPDNGTIIGAPIGPLFNVGYAHAWKSVRATIEASL